MTLTTIAAILTLTALAIPVATFCLTRLGKRWKERERRKRWKVRK